MNTFTTYSPEASNWSHDESLYYGIKYIGRYRWDFDTRHLGVIRMSGNQPSICDRRFNKFIYTAVAPGFTVHDFAAAKV